MSSTPKQAPGRKPYHAPLLQHYGDLSRITGTVGRNGMMDGGVGNMKGTLP